MAFDVSAISEPLTEINPTDIAAEAVAALEALRGGEYVARNGSVEVVLMEALALAVSNVTDRANDVIGAIVEAVLANGHQVPRLPGASAVGELTLTFDSSVTTTIFAGTAFVMRDSGLEVTATEDVEVSASTSAVVEVESTDATTLLNGVGAEASVDVLDVIPNLLSVAVSTAFAGGADPEDDAVYLARAQNRLARVTSSLVLADHFSAYVLEDGRARNAAAIAAWDGADIATAGSDGAHVTVATYGNGAQLSSEVRAELADEMSAITAEGVTVHVNEASLETVAVTVSVAAQPGEDSATVRAAVEAALTAYLDPMSWTFGETVRTTSLTALIAGVTGVDYVDTLTAPASDVTLDADQVATVGTLTVSVS